MFCPVLTIMWSFWLDWVRIENRVLFSFGLQLYMIINSNCACFDLAIPFFAPLSVTLVLRNEAPPFGRRPQEHLADSHPVTAFIAS